MPKDKAVNVFAYEAIYHSIGDAAKVYAKKMKRMSSNEAFSYKDIMHMHPTHVTLEIQKHRNKLLSIFRPKMPLPELKKPSPYIQHFSDYELQYDLKYHPKAEQTYKRIIRIERSRKDLFAAVVKACDAALSDLVNALDHYKTKEGVTMAGVPADIKDIPKKVKAQFAAIKKLAASSGKKATKALASARKGFKVAQAKRIAADKKRKAAEKKAAAKKKREEEKKAKAEKKQAKAKAKAKA